MDLYLYNSLSKKKELFKPINNIVKMYVCGPTVYDTPHMGNARSMIVYDLLYRLLINEYGIDNVKYVRNITDVDDKINIEAKRRNISIDILTNEITSIFHNIEDQLNCLSPNIEPKATDHIGEMIYMIEKLIDNGNAYISDNHVYFDVKSFKNYSKLSGRNLDELFSGVRIDLSESKNSNYDFVLWKPAIDEYKSWNSPWGLGRPGWHIECSAMSCKYLGSSFDIHGGGIDLIFPHHTNEIAQSCSVYPDSQFARYWIHNGFVTVDGEKMSKSIGNFITVEDLFNKKISPEVIRYFLLSVNYKKPIDFSDNAIDNAKKTVDSFYHATEFAKDHITDISNDAINELYDDLNISKFLAKIHNAIDLINKSDDQKYIENQASIVKNTLQFIGLLNIPFAEYFSSDIDIKDIETLINDRYIAKKNKDWLLADFIRNKLYDKNIIIEDKPDGSTIWRYKT